ncbi:MAG: hypothetical protein ACREBO_02750 [Novosphingobium sp.]
MPLRFAAAHPLAHRFLARCVPTGTIAPAANDNSGETLSDTLLRAALKHFGRYGLGAAENAKAQAERAFFMGDRESYDWWLSVCRALDRRMAAKLADGREQRDCREV